jgi:hypothetical protein
MVVEAVRAVTLLNDTAYTEVVVAASALSGALVGFSPQQAQEICDGFL